MIFGLELPTVVSMLTALGALALGIVAQRNSARKEANNTVDEHLRALREMYKQFVDDLREEIDRLQRENEKLTKLVRELRDKIIEYEHREEELQERLRLLEEKLRRALDDSA